MFWNNKRETNNNFFLWGLFAGAIGIVYLARMMNKTQFFKDSNEQQHGQQKSKAANSPSQKFGNENKDELFNTFINGSEQDLKNAAKEMNF